MGTIKQCLRRSSLSMNSKPDVWQGTLALKYCELTRARRKEAEEETREWERMTEIVARFLTSKKGLA